MTDPVPRILVVDDEPAIRDLIVAILEDEGYVAIGVANASAALALMLVEQPDLVLMDIMMPEMDGREALRRMRAQPSLARIPIVLMSAALAPDRIAQRISAFVAKPFDLDQLLSTVAQVLGARDRNRPPVR